MVNFSEIVGRIKLIEHLQTDKELAEIFGLSPPDLSKRKKSGSLLPLIISWGISNKVNLHWLLTGEGDPDFYKDGFEKVISIDPAVQMLREVEEETGRTLNTRQREAVIKILRKELESREQNSKAEIKDLITSFKEVDDDG